MMFRSSEISGFEFVRVSALRAAQLMRGCTPRVAASAKATITAQREVAAGTVRDMPHVTPPPRH